MKPTIDLGTLPENCPGCGAKSTERHFVYAIPESGVGESVIYCPAIEGREAVIRMATKKRRLALYYEGWLRGWKVTGPEGEIRTQSRRGAFLAGFLDAAQANEATYVYYFYDRQGNLLYVGMTDNIERRWAQHAVSKPWWHMVARKEYVQYPTRTEAARVEAHQIRIQRPMFNRAINGWKV